MSEPKISTFVRIREQGKKDDLNKLVIDEESCILAQGFAGWSVRAAISLRQYREVRAQRDEALARNERFARYSVVFRNWAIVWMIGTFVMAAWVIVLLAGGK